MAITTRGGNKADFDPNKMVPKEIAGTFDTKEIFYAFGPGDVKQLATKEDFQADLDAINDNIERAETAIAVVKSLAIDKAYINDTTPTLTEAYSGVKSEQLYDDAIANINDLTLDVNEVKGEVTEHKADGTQHAKTARFVVGTSTAGWTSADCDYLCDGTADQTEINAAITDLPATGGEIVILDGTYNISAKIDVNKSNVSIVGNGNATILKRMYDSTSEEGVITLTGRSGCKIADLQVDGNKTSYTNNNNYGIYLGSPINNTVTGNTCNNNYGIYLAPQSTTLSPATLAITIITMAST